jgi:hypothetical protein
VSPFLFEAEMFRPTNVPFDSILGRQFAREESPPEPPKKRAVTATPEKIREVMAAIKAEDSSFIISEKNIEKIFYWLWENDAADGFTLQNVRTAIAVLGDEIEREARPPSPPPPPKPGPEKLESWQIPLSTPSYAIKQVLAKASATQIKDYLARSRAQQK